MAIKFILLIVFLILPACAAYSVSTGIVFNSRSTSNCACHCETPSSKTTLALLQGKTTVLPNEIINFTLSLQHSSYPKAGVAISIEDPTGKIAGELSVDEAEGLRVFEFSPKQLVHSRPKEFSFINGVRQVVWSFRWKAPATTGVYTMYAVGNAVNFQSGSNETGDWQFLTPIPITVSNSATSVVELHQDECTLYPQPASSHITISPSTLSDIYIFNELGQPVYTALQQTQLIWDTRSSNGTPVPSGTYTAILTSNNKRSYKQFVVLR